MHCKESERATRCEKQLDVRRPSHAPDSPMFISRLRDGRPVIEPMTDADLIANVRRLIRAALPGREPRQYAGHSFRRGGATALALVGVLVARIQRHGRWTSEAYKAYI
jgi:hypothetical protein